MADGERIDIKSVSFSNASDINEFFKQYNEGGFIPWFNGLRNKFLKKNRPLNSITSSKHFNLFWNLIPTIFGKESINLAEFLTLNNIVCVETGAKYTARTERVGTSGHPGIAYAFDKISGLKASYNTLNDNLSAFELFNDPDFIEAHGNKPLANELKNTTDNRWKGEAFPLGFSGNSNREVSSSGNGNGFLFEADFMKFRGRGFIQSTGRGKYKDLIEYIKIYSGSNSVILKYKQRWGSISTKKALNISSNDDWDELFKNTDSIIPAYAVRKFSDGRTAKGTISGSPLYHINIASDQSISNDAFNAGWQTNGSRSYGNDIRNIVNTQLEELSIVPPEPAPGEPAPATSPTETTGNDTSSGYSQPNEQYPDDLPKVEGLKNFFRPEVKLKPIDFEIPTSQERQEEVASTIGYQPFVWYLSYQLRFIKSLTLSSKGLLPTLRVTFTDTISVMNQDGFPLDDSKIKVFLNSRTPSLRPIFMEFKIVNFSQRGNNYTIDGICDINKFFLREYEAYSNMSSFECLQEFARRSGLGFNSNVTESDDIMNWINPGQQGSKFIKDVIRTSYRSDESFIWAYVDFYYNLNYIDVEEALKIDVSNQTQVKNTGLENINGVNNKKEETSRLWLTDDPSMDQTNQFISDYKVLNNSTSISLKNGYLNQTKFYNINDKNYLIFDVDSITSEGDNTIIMKGSPQDMEFFEAHIRPTYVGKIDSDNMHDNYNYSVIQNEQNIVDLQKVGVDVTLKTPNYNLYRYQKLNVTFSGTISTPTSSQINQRLSGDWLIIDINFVYVNGEFNQKLTLVRRGLSLSPQEEANEATPNNDSDTNSGTNDNPGSNENEIDTSGDEIEVEPDNELTPFSYDLTFTNAAEINDFFDQYNTQGYVGFFNDEFSSDTTNFTPGLIVDRNDPNLETERTINSANWTKIWNLAVTTIYNDNREGAAESTTKQEFNIVEFLSLTTLIYYLTGGDFKSITNNQGLVDLFQKNNQLEGNKTAFELFNNATYISVNESKKFGDILSNTTNTDWDSNSFPVGFSGPPYIGGFLNIKIPLTNGDQFTISNGGATETYEASTSPTLSTEFLITGDLETDYTNLVTTIESETNFNISVYFSNNGLKTELNYSELEADPQKTSLAASSTNEDGLIIRRVGDDKFQKLVDSGVVAKETSKEGNEFITHSDFYKFRTRGLVPVTGRGQYLNLINYVKSYNGSNSTISKYKTEWSEITQNGVIATQTNDNTWNELFSKTDLTIPSLSLSNVMFNLQQVHIIPTEGRSEQQIFKAIKNVGKLVGAYLDNAPDNFQDTYFTMVKRQIDFLNSKELVPAKDDSVQEPGNYDLDLIPGEYVDNSGKKIKLCQIDGSPINVEVAEAYLTMRDAAKKDGVDLKINSGFRSPYDTINATSDGGVKVRASSQKYLYDGYKAGKKGFNLAAKPGRSQHGNGIGFDLNTGGSSRKRFSNVNRKNYEWLVKNSYKYGFVRTVRREEWHYDYLPERIKSSGKGPYAKLEGTDANKFYSDWGLDSLA